jgi:hypothetical protein
LLVSFNKALGSWIINWWSTNKFKKNLNDIQEKECSRKTNRVQVTLLVGRNNKKNTFKYISKSFVSESIKNRSNSSRW